MSQIGAPEPKRDLCPACQNWRFEPKLCYSGQANSEFGEKLLVEAFVRKDTLPLAERSEWAEPLPEDCPPPEAWEPNNDVFYRLIRGQSPTVDDFFSYRKLQPDKYFSVGECQARSLSILDDVDKAQMMAKLPVHRNKRVMKLALPAECGVVLQTGKPSHHSWWLKAAFDPVSICEPV